MSVVGLSFGSPTSGDGFDVSSTVSSIVANLQNIETPWKTQLTKLESQDTAISSLGTLLSTLSTDMSNLTDATGVLSEKTGSSSNTDVLELTSASTSATAGTHTVLVSDLAKTSSGSLTTITDSSDTLAGSITITVGSGTAQTVTLDSSDDTLSGLASAINSAGIGVTASVLTDSSGSRLSLVSGTSGADGTLTISSAITDTSNSSAAVSYDTSTAVAGANGTITVDNVQLSVSSNTVTDLIPGLTMQLLSTSTTAVQVVIGNYNTGVESAVNVLVNDYNSLVSAMSVQEGQDSSGNNEPLYGSPTLTLLQQDILGSINTTNPSGYLDAISASDGTTLAGSMTITVGTGTAQTITLDSSDNTLAGLASAINSTSIGVTAAVVTKSGESTLELTSQTTGSAGALTVSSAITATSDTALSATVTSGSSTVTSSATLTTVAAEGDTLSGSIAIAVGSGKTQTITLDSSDNTLAGLASAINKAKIGVTASVDTARTALTLTSGTSGSSGSLTVTSSILDTTDTSSTTLSYTKSSDITNLAAMGITVDTDGTISLDATTLDSVLNSDYSGVQALFQNANSWGLTFSSALTNAGTSSSTGILKLAETAISSNESTLNADITREESLISAETSSLTKELNSANEIMQELPSELSQVNELYSAITGYNESS
jgi:flagellar hook-associated protein 2